MTHKYVSTACVHDRHDVCDKVCNLCEGGCLCTCHDTAQQTLRQLKQALDLAMGTASYDNGGLVPVSDNEIVNTGSNPEPIVITREELVGSTGEQLASVSYLTPVETKSKEPVPEEPLIDVQKKRVLELFPDNGWVPRDTLETKVQEELRLGKEAAHDLIWDTVADELIGYDYDSESYFVK